MATSGYRTVSVTSYDSLKFSWERTSYSVANNTSTISWKMQLISTANGAISSSASKKWSVTVNGTKYSGTNTVGIAANSTKTLASDTTTIKHNSDGTKTFSYSFSQTFDINFNGTVGTKSGSGSGTLNSIPRKATISSAPNFNDEGNPQITYSNPAGSSVSSLQACIADSAGNILIDYRDISKTGTSYTFSLTSAERTTLRKHITSGSSATVRFYVKTVIGDTTYRSYLSKTLSLVNYTPTLSPTVVDTGSTSTALTGDPNIVIKGFNVMSVSSGGAARKNATIKSQKITCGSKSISSGSGTLSYVDSGTFKFTITDSRGHTTTKTVTKTLIPYVPITCSYKANLNVDGTGKVTANGVCFNGSFGAKDNDLTVEYRYKLASSSTWGNWLSIEDVTWNENNTYTATANLEGFDYQQAYSVQVRAVDKIGNASPSAKTMRALPVFDWGESSFHHHTAAIVDNGKAFAGFKADGTMANIGWISSADNLIIGGGNYPPNNIYLTAAEGGSIYASNDNNSNIYNLLGAAKALANTYTFSCTVTPGTNYSAADATAVLVGGDLRITFSGTRKSASGTGNIADEVVCNVSFNHGGKLKSIYRSHFPIVHSQGTGMVYNLTNENNICKFDIMLCGVSVASTAPGSYFTLPCSLSLSAFV